MFGRTAEPVETLGVASLNAMIDKTRSDPKMINHPEYIEPQYMRVESLAGTLGSLPVPLGVVMLQELHITPKHHNGEYLRESLGLKQGFWFEHNTDSRKNEYLGVMGDDIEYAYAIDVGGDRRAVVAKVGEVILVNMHNRSGEGRAKIRAGQTQRALNEVRRFGKVILTGDSNSHSREIAREMIRQEGYSSVHRMRGPLPGVPGVLPATFPTDNYRNIRLTRGQSRVLRTGLALDIMEVKGFTRREIIQAGVVMTEKSDHKTVYTEVAI